MQMLFLRQRCAVSRAAGGRRYALASLIKMSAGVRAYRVRAAQRSQQSQQPDARISSNGRYGMGRERHGEYGFFLMPTPRPCRPAYLQEVGGVKGSGQVCVCVWWCVAVCVCVQR